MSSGSTLSASNNRKEATVAELQAGGALLVEDGNHGEYRPRQDEFTSDGVAFIRAADIHEGRILFQSASRIDDTALARVRKGIGAPGDVLLSHKGTVGKVAFAPLNCEPFVCSPQTTFWRVLDESVLDRRYLFYYLRSDPFRQQLNARKSETDMAEYVSLTAQRALRIALPPMTHQHLVGEMLGSLDDKVEVNRLTVQTLEEIARALFHSWFVALDPVIGTSRFGDDVRRLFPSRVVESPIGPVPKGWDVRPLGQHVEVTRGLSYTGAGLADEGMPLHNLNSIREGGGYKEDGIKHYVGDFRERDLVRPGDLIVANTEQGFEHLLIGFPAIVPRVFGERALFSQDLCRLRPLEGSPLTQRWLYLLLVGHRMHHLVAGYSNGTTVNHLAMDGLKKPLIVVPPREVVERFDAIVAPMFEQQETLAAESKTLAQLRDTVLPKLISGEVRLEGVS